MEQYKLIFADLDGTLIETLSGLKTFSEGIWDMRFKIDVLKKLKEIQPQCLIIVTNQAGISYGYVNEESFNIKMSYVTEAIKEFTGIPVVEYYYCAFAGTHYDRKPNIGMLDKAMKKYPGFNRNEILMIGDASGKPGQFSDSDKKTAENFGCEYMDVNDFASAKI